MESITQYKIYKSGKKWVIAGLVAMSVGLGVVTTTNTMVSADNVTTSANELNDGI